MASSPLKIETVIFNAKYLPAFVEFNREWIEKHFILEPMDLAQLQAPQKSILEPGGEIFFVLENGTSGAASRLRTLQYRNAFTVILNKFKRLQKFSKFSSSELADPEDLHRIVSIWDNVSTSFWSLERLILARLIL